MRHTRVVRLRSLRQAGKTSDVHWRRLVVRLLLLLLQRLWCRLVGVRLNLLGPSTLSLGWRLAVHLHAHLGLGCRRRKSLLAFLRGCRGRSGGSC